MNQQPEERQSAAFVRDQLRRLGVRRFVLGVHASAFPAGAWDAGYGAPSSSAGERLLAFAARLGFDAIQLGPSGCVSPVNLSPYDGTVFARNPWSLDLAALASDAYAHLLQPEASERLALGGNASSRVEPERVERAARAALDACHVRFAQLRAAEPESSLVARFEQFRVEHSDWLELNALYEVIASRTVDDPARFEPALVALFEPGLAGVQRRAAVRATLGPAIERAELAQFLCHAQHADFRARAGAFGLRVWGDMQVGFSQRDRFLHRDGFSTRFWLGAPPSRTNPHGQPWGYPVLHPDQLDFESSPARLLFSRRVRKLLAEYDGVRIDHPHGLVCPWVYAASAPDPHHAVAHGDRAFESPDSPDPELQRWAIATHDDLEPGAHSRFADNRVRQLDDAQVARYSRLFDVLAQLTAETRALGDVLAAEVLSTCPYPLQRVLERHGLGRFRVTQKAKPQDPHDVYRTEHAEPEDWLMLGTHDTPPIYPLATGWLRDGGARSRAAYLAQRLIRDDAERAAAAATFASSERNLLCAMLADLFASRAESVYVFVGDLFGEVEPFNRAGIIHPDNWTARLQQNFEAVYEQRVREGRAIDVAAAVQLAATGECPR